MYRLIVALLAALDALVQAAVGLAAVTVPLTLLWTFQFGGNADWATLWPATVKIWQLGNLVPLSITLPESLLAAGIPLEAATFTLSLAPLAFAAFTVLFGLRSGARAARAGAWMAGAVVALIVAAAASTVVALTSSIEVATTSLAQAIVIPASLYGGSVLVGGVVTAWRHGDDGVIDRLRDRLDARGALWGAVVSATCRSAAIALVGLIGIASVALTAAIALRGASIVALFQASNVDALGASLVMLGQLAYLPTMIIWSLSWVAGPGFALGAGTAVSPVGTEVGVLPGIPMLGAIPDLSSPWMLLVILLPLGVGVAAGWMARTTLLRAVQDARDAQWRGTAQPPHEPMLPRLITAAGIAVLTAAGAALLVAAASGSMGPGSLAHVGPQVGPVALAVGVEVLIGAGILLLLPRRVDHTTAQGPAPTDAYEYAGTPTPEHR